MRGIKNFVKKIFNNGEFDGCWYFPLDAKKHVNEKDDLYLVFAYDENNELICKIAYNCDDLQCDYDFDWYEPETEDGDYIGNEWYDCIANWNVDELVKSVKTAYKYIRSCRWKYYNF